MRNQKGQLKEVIKKEYVKCANDPVYFLKKYCVVQHPIKGKIPFNLYEFQEKSISEFVTNRFNIILKARQLGISTLTAGYSLWMMTFHQDKNILVILESISILILHKSLFHESHYHLLLPGLHMSLGDSSIQS